MYRNPAATWLYNGRISTPEICEHCGRILRHEKWCITRDTDVRYAYALVTDAEKLTLRDRLILQVLGADWGVAPCTRDFQQRAESNVVVSHATINGAMTTQVPSI